MQNIFQKGLHIASGADSYSDPVEGETRMSKILLNGNNICMV